MIHKRLRPFNTKDTYPEQKLNTDLSQGVVARGTMALPAFGADSGQVPGSAGRGRIAGPPPQSAEEWLALAVLYMALLTVSCADCLGESRRVILDGSYLGDPLYGSLVAALRPGAETLVNHESYGVAAGAALLCSHERRAQPATLALGSPAILKDLTALSNYAAQWRDDTRQQQTKG